MKAILIYYHPYQICAVCHVLERFYQLPFVIVLVLIFTMRHEHNFGSSVSTSYWCLPQVLHLALRYLNDNFINISMLVFLFNLLEHSPSTLPHIARIPSVPLYSDCTVLTQQLILEGAHTSMESNPPQWATTAIASPKPTTTLNQMNLFYTFQTYFFRIPFILHSHLLRVVNGLFSSGFPTKTLYTCVFSPTHATCPTHLTFLDIIKQMNRSTENMNSSSHIKQYHYISNPKPYTYFQSL